MSETQDRLNWLAFCYVANELDANEVNEFELLLATDQAAREAVANAVAETTQIRQALTGVVTVASRRSNWNGKTTRVAVVAVGSCLTLFLAICLVRSSSPIAGGIAQRTVDSDQSVSPAQLAYVWAESRNGSTELQPSTNVVLSDALDAVSIAAIDADSEQSLAAPSWMLAALAKMDSGIGSDLEIPE